MHRRFAAQREAVVLLDQQMVAAGGDIQRAGLDALLVRGFAHGNSDAGAQHFGQAAVTIAGEMQQRDQRQ